MTDEERKAKRRAYYQKNRQKISAANYAYFLEHRDEINAKRRERYVNDPEYREKTLENGRRYHKEQRAYLKALRERKAALNAKLTETGTRTVEDAGPYIRDIEKGWCGEA